MFIEKYSVLIKDLTGKKSKKIKIDANDVYEAHKKSLEHCNELNQDIYKISNYEGTVVYSLESGFCEG